MASSALDGGSNAFTDAPDVSNMAEVSKRLTNCFIFLIIVPPVFKFIVMRKPSIKLLII